MRDWKEEARKLDAQRKRAHSKVESQSGVVRRMNGSAREHPEEQQLLNEMQQNKASVDLNHALFEYEERHKGERNREDE